MSKVSLTFLLIVVFFFGFVLAKAIEKQSEEIKTVSMSRNDIEKTLTLSGYIEPERVIDVRSSISGTLDKLLVKVGDVVVQGKSLASIRFVMDPVEVRRLRDNLEVSKNKLDVITSQFERSETLYNEGFLAKEEYENVVSEYVAMKKNYETLVAELAMVTGEQTNDMIPNVINATNSGTVIELPIKEGGSVMARGLYSEGSIIARIADLSCMVFEGYVSEVDVDKIKVGTPITFSVATSPTGVVNGVISSISPTATRGQSIITYSVYATIDLSTVGSTHIYSGCSAIGTIVTEKETNVWSLNEKYLHYEGDSVYVDVLDEKERVKKKYVKIGISDGRNAQIVSGIDSLSQIVELD